MQTKTTKAILTLCAAVVLVGLIHLTAIPSPAQFEPAPGIKTGSVFPFAGPVLSGATWRQQLSSNIGTGDIDLYTCPSGKRCFLFATWCGTPSSTITARTEVKVGGSYWFTNSGASVTTSSPYVRSPAFVLEAGEVAAVNTSGTGLNCSAAALVYDAAAPLFTARKVASWVNGNNTIYTCCGSGKTAAVQIAQGATINGISGDENFNYVNLSGTTAAFKLHFVPNGVTLGTATTFVSTNISSSSALIAPFMQIALRSGDAVVVGTDQTGSQFAWMTIMEY